MKSGRISKKESCKFTCEAPGLQSSVSHSQSIDAEQKLWCDHKHRLLIVDSLFLLTIAIVKQSLRWGAQILIRTIIRKIKDL